MACNISGTPNPTVTVGVPYDDTSCALPNSVAGLPCTALPADAVSINWGLVSGALPDGLVLAGKDGPDYAQQTMEISGIPTVVGHFEFQVTAAWLDGQADNTPTFTIDVLPASAPPSRFINVFRVLAFRRHCNRRKVCSNIASGKMFVRN